MNLEFKQPMIDLMLRHELKVGELYQAYAAKFPEYAASWEFLASEETEHADWLKALQERVNQGEAFIQTDRFHSTALETSLEYLQGELARAAAYDFSFINALAVARSIENSLIEQRYFEVFESDLVGVKQIFTKLLEDTKRHKQFVEDLIQKHKG